MTDRGDRVRPLLRLFIIVRDQAGGARRDVLVLAAADDGVGVGDGKGKGLAGANPRGLVNAQDDVGGKAVGLAEAPVSEPDIGGYTAGACPICRRDLPDQVVEDVSRVIFSVDHDALTGLQTQLLKETVRVSLVG